MVFIVAGAVLGIIGGWPSGASYDVQGKAWVIEGVGVEPDIYVDNDPAKEYASEDQQLDKAIEVVLDLLKQNPGTLAPPPPYPIKRGGSGGG